MRSLTREMVGPASMRDAGPMRRALAILVTLTIALMGVVIMPIHAAANPNENIIIDQVVLGEGSGEDGQLIIGDKIAVEGTWDASQADPEAGDTFTIGLPPELGFDTDLPINLEGENPDGEIVVWATCLTDSANDEVVCTLSDEVTEYPLEVHGTFLFEVEVVGTTTEDEVVFDLNGINTPVTVPGEGGISDGIEIPDEWSKTGWMNSNNWSMTWQIDLPGSRMEGHETLTIRDTLGEGHELCEPADLQVQTVRGENTGGFTGGVDIVPTDDSQIFDIVLSAPEGGFDPNVVHRITYTTCTPDGRIDPVDTEYTNEAQIDVWGEGSGVIGVSPEPWQGDIFKSGSVFGGADRNGKIGWTVTVPGDGLVGKNSFTLSEQLGDGHEVGADTISNIRILERYGPSGQRETDVTDQFDATIISEGSDAFEVTYTISSSNFELKASDYRYIITYATYVSQEGLPGGGTTYANEVSVDGTLTNSTAKVPGRNDGKRGSLGRSFVTIDGVEHAPQTTLNWQARIPGERLADVNSDLTLTDTLSGSHEVCMAGDPTGGLADRLNLKVQAIDQIKNGGLSTVDLTGSTSVTQDGDDILFTIPPPILATPDGGEETGFSAEYQYLLTYTTCTTSGGMDAPGTEYGNAITGSSITYGQTVEQKNRGSGTGTGVSRGSITVSKDLDAQAPGAEFVPDGTDFTVHVKEFDPNGTMQVEYDLQVPLNGDPVSGLNSRGNGWTAELSEPQFPDVPGVAFGDPIFTDGEGIEVSDAGTVATVSLTPRSNVEVSLTNTTLLGSVALEKAVDVLDESILLPERTYEVTAHIDTSDLGDHVPAQDDRTVELTPGEPVTIDNLPVGATVTFTETGLTDDDVLTWNAPVFSPSSVVVGPDTAQVPADVIVTNSVERTVGTFSIAKNVVGDESDNPAVPDTVTVNATWDEEGTAGEKTLEIPTDGTPVPLGENLLIGTQVTLTETPIEDGSSITWGTPTWSSGGITVDSNSITVTVDRNDDATVTVTNHANTSTATLDLIKSVSGDGAVAIPDGTEFPVTAAWTDSEGIEQSRDLVINSDEATPLGEDLPAGTVVTVTEDERPGFTAVDWADITISGDNVTDSGDGSAEVIISDQQSQATLVTVTNEATWAEGTFTLSKTIVDTPGGELVADGTVFTVNVAEYDPDGALGNEYEIAVPLNGDPVTASNSFGPGWTAVLTEPTFPDVPGVVFGDPVFESADGVTVSEDGLSATVAYSPGQDVPVILTNEAELGKISLRKELTGDAAGHENANRTFEVTASIDTSELGENFPAQGDRVVELTAGETVTIDNVPVGATVTFDETALMDDDILTWDEPVFTPESVVVSAETVNSPAEVVLTNTVERTVGTFDVSKVITGEQADNPAVPETVTINAMWDEEGVSGETTLEVPTDGTSVPLGADLLIGTEVTLTEVPLEDQSSIAWAMPAWSGDGVTIDGESAVVTVTRDADATVVVENHAATSVAGISILKSVAGEAASEVSPETEFPITATWTDGEGVQQSRDLNINSTEPTPLGEELPANTVVTISERERPSVNTVIWDGIVIGGTNVTDHGDGSADVVVSDQQDDVTLVTVTNEATWAPGTFNLAKLVDGVPLDNSDVPDTVTVNATWVEAIDQSEDGETGELTTVTHAIEIPSDGTPVEFGKDLPHGTSVTLSEHPLAESPAFSWGTPAWDDIDGLVINEDGSATLTIAAAQNPTVTLTNTASPKLGSLSIVKDLSGSGADKVSADSTFPVTASWRDLIGNDQTVELELIPGEPAVIDEVPLGTDITLVEGVVDVPVGATWEGATWSADSDAIRLNADDRTATVSITGDAGDTAVMTLDNEYQSDAPGDPGSGDSGDLPLTGADVRTLAVIALLLIAAGVATYMATRRKDARG